MHIESLPCAIPALRRIRERSSELEEDGTWLHSVSTVLLSTHIRLTFTPSEDQRKNFARKPINIADLKRRQVDRKELMRLVREDIASGRLPGREAEPKISGGELTEGLASVAAC